MAVNSEEAVFFISKKERRNVMKVSDTVNLVGGVAITFLSAIFGDYWFLFVGFLFANVLDWLTGWAASRYEKKESSAAGAKGIVKKVSYWLVIMIAFYTSYSFVSMGEKIGLNLSFTFMVGWFTLATYLINELRSILENLVRLDVKIPVFLVKGLKIANEMIEDITNMNLPEEKQEQESEEKE